jgi:hypothetical protein
MLSANCFQSKWWNMNFKKSLTSKKSPNVLTGTKFSLVAICWLGVTHILCVPRRTTDYTLWPLPGHISVSAAKINSLRKYHFATKMWPMSCDMQSTIRSEHFPLRCAPHLHKWTRVGTWVEKGGILHISQLFPYTENPPFAPLYTFVQSLSPLFYNCFLLSWILSYWIFVDKGIGNSYLGNFWSMGGETPVPNAFQRTQESLQKTVLRCW